MSETGKLTDPTRYQSFLIRLWREGAGDSWRILLINVPTGEQRFFATLDETLTYVQACVLAPPNQSTFT